MSRPTLRVSPPPEGQPAPPIHPPLVLFVRRTGTTPGEGSGETPSGTLPAGARLTLPDYRIGSTGNGDWTRPSYTADYPAGVTPIGAAPLVGVNGVVSNQVVSRLPSGQYRVTFAAQIAAVGGKMTVRDTVNPALSADLFRTFGLAQNQHPDTSAPFWGFRVGAIYADPSAQNGRVFLGSAVPSVMVYNGDGKITGWEARDFAGNVVATGGPPALGYTSIQIPEVAGKPNSYRVWFLGRDVPGFGNAIACTNFNVIPEDAPDGSDMATNYHPLGYQPAFGPSPGGFQLPNEWLQARVYAGVAGPQRISVPDAANPDIVGLSAYIIGAVNAQITGNDGTAANPADPGILFCNFFNLDCNYPDQVAGVTRAVAAFYALGVRYFAGRNEPGGNPNSSFIPQMRAFYNAVKAGHPDAQVCGVESVQPYAPAHDKAGNVPSLENLFAAGGGDYIDVFSYHLYGNSAWADSSIGSDIDQGLRMLAAQEAFLTRHGQQHKERLMTEQGAVQAAFGVTSPWACAAGWWTQLMVMDARGQKTSHECYWFTAASDPEWQVQLRNSDGSYNPQILWMRRRAVECWSANCTGTLDFGRGGGSLWFATNWQGVGARQGRNVALIYGKGGYRREGLRIAVSGPNVPATLTGANAWGAETILPVVSGVVTLPPGDGLGYYLRYPASVTLSPLTGLGPNLALGRPVIAPTNQTQAQSLTDGVGAVLWSSDSAWFAHGTPVGSDVFIAGDTALPYRLCVDLGAGDAGQPPALSRLIASTAVPYQSACGILSCKVFTADDMAGPLLYQGSFSQSGNGLERLTNNGTLGTNYTDYFPAQTKINMAFAAPGRHRYAVLEIDDVSLGTAGNALSAGYGGQPSISLDQRHTPPNITLRQLEVY